MIGSFVLGVSMFCISNSVYYVAFNVLIKNLEGLLTLEHDRPHNKLQGVYVVSNK